MNIVSFTNVVFIFCYCLNIEAQTIKNNTKIEDDIDYLIAEKRKINPNLVSSERYCIQIFWGDIEKAKKTAIQFKQEFKDVDATIVFSTPNYKVLVGSFKTRMEAERISEKINLIYKNTLLIKPSQ